MKFLMNKQSILNAQNLGRVEPLEYHGGGGDSKSTSTQGFAEEYKPYITRFLGEAEDGHNRGDFNKVAGFNNTQNLAQHEGVGAAGVQTDLERRLASNSNISYDNSMARLETDAALNRGADAAGLAGGVGGSRNAINNAQVHQAGRSSYENERATRQSNAHSLQGGGADRLANIGGQIQKQSQNEMDAPWQGTSRWASLLHGTVPKETTTNTSGGSK